MVLTTAPTERQVKELLWREIRHRKAGAVVDLPGKPLIMKMEIDAINYMLGFSTNDPQQMQGFHSPNILFIIDEANRYPTELYEAVEGILSGGERRILFQIGNPIEPSGPFFESFSQPGVWTHTISGLNHPNVTTGKNIIPGAVTREWVERIRMLWGEDSAFWYSRVLGEFPLIASDIVVNLSWVEQAERNKPSKKKGETIYMGHDVAEYGDDEHVWFIGTPTKRLETIVKRHIEPAASIGETKRLKTKYNIVDKNITIDGIGAGAVICSQLKLEGVNVNRFVASETALDHKTFENKGTESWWNIRTLLNPNGEEYENYSLNGKQDRLKADLCTRKYETNTRTSRYMLEPKKPYRKRMKRSPDWADAMALCYSFMSKRKIYGIQILPDVIGA